MTKLSLTTLSVAVAMSYPALARATILDTYVCDLGDMSYSVTLDANLMRDAFVDVSISEMMDKSLARKFYISGRRSSSGFSFKGKDVEFFGKGNTAFLMLGSERHSCELLPVRR